MAGGNRLLDVARGTWRPRLAYWLAYALGRTPWDTGISPPELVELVEGADKLDPGRALDLGCGTGTNALYLWRHGWDVIGVDFTHRPLVRAKRRAASASASVRFIEADVTRLAELGLQPGFGLVLDIGCFHSLAARGRRAYGEGVAQLSSSGATLMIFSFRRQVSDAAVRDALDPWFQLQELIPGVGHADPVWYRMRRMAA